MGPEDAERLRRTLILGHKVKWTSNNPAYHLFHPRNKNSNFFDEETEIATRYELIKICNMDRKELEEYIKTW